MQNCFDDLGIKYYFDNGVLTIETADGKEITGLSDNNIPDVTEVIIKGKCSVVNCFNNSESLKKVTVIGFIAIRNSFNKCPNLTEVYLESDKAIDVESVQIKSVGFSFCFLPKLYKLRAYMHPYWHIYLRDSFTESTPKEFYNNNFHDNLFLAQFNSLAESRVDGVYYHKIDLDFSMLEPTYYRGHDGIKNQSTNIVHLAFRDGHLDKANSVKSQDSEDIHLDFISGYSGDKELLYIFESIKYLLLEAFDTQKYFVFYHAEFSELKYVYLNRNARLSSKSLNILSSGLAYKSGVTFLIEEGYDTDIFIRYRVNYKFVQNMEEALQIIREDSNESLEEEKKARGQIQKAKLIGKPIKYSSAYAIKHLEVLSEIEDTLNLLNPINSNVKLVEPERLISIPGLGSFNTLNRLATLIEYSEVFFRKYRINNLSCSLDEYCVKNKLKIDARYVFNIKDPSNNVEFIAHYIGNYIKKAMYLIIKVGSNSITYLVPFDSLAFLAMDNIAKSIPVSMRYLPGDILPTELTNLRICGVAIPCTPLFGRVGSILSNNLMLLYRTVNDEEFKAVLLDTGLGKVIVVKTKGKLTKSERLEYYKLHKFMNLFSKIYYIEECNRPLEVVAVYNSLSELAEKRPQLVKAISESYI